MNSRLLELKFQLENCDWITIPGKYIGSFCVTDIKKYISRLDINYIGEYDVAESIFIEIHRDANTFHKQFGEIQNYGHTKFKRLMEWNDITGIEFSIETSCENGLVTKNDYSYTVDWCEMDDFNNQYQKTYLSPLGHLYVVISATKDIFDVFDNDEINNQEWMDKRFNIMSV